MAPTSWLLSLPRELRDKIYEFVAINEDLLRVKTTPPTVERRQLASRSGLILACRQLHDEYPEDLLANSLKPDNLIIIEVIVLDGDFSRAFDFARHLTPTQCAMINGYQLLVTQWYSEHMQFGSATFLANWCHCTVRDSNLQSYIDDKKRGSDNRPCEDIELWELCEVLWTRENSPLSPRRGTTHGGISRMKRMLSVLTKIRGLTVKANMERSERRRDQRDEGLGQLTSWGAFKMPAAVLEHQGAATAGPSLATNGRESDLRGSEGTAYEGGTWTLSISIPPSYPNTPPEIHFQTPICHANVSFKTGEICLDLLKTSWTPAYGIVSTLEAVQQLLSAGGEPDSPLNIDVAVLLREGDSVAAESLVRFYTRMYAMGR
ncbi:hypothetical protein LTR91_022963 [Friedmanniomyces endolithicus]|uniref:UBC core domain-containing protein n=1 Tax=Friedmanniomyces endolithicus TaxID=329885 RepID=A0AAN6K416_9PEZI|nr:hypothetical protein LTR94_018822 [Friedmanniomyces endolithicus]KAK0792980.1 hypothetical protein LTR59_008352 [Friedmanniomyces endolithicus]KAK0900467.1 hypothetical protein LTR57_020618 [Friedmanniomyces endolithicus]KAK0955201.1 hypothetical protein LTR91_022963 [Friedmanniomyces endolithicus]KAK0957771.1 hypothetical protein LTS01_022207 [Friedmanniomyces endolithicus]